MNASKAAALVCAVALGTAWTPAQEEPLRVPGVTRETVRLIVLDTVVVDRKGHPVTDLTREDFEIVAAGKPVTIDTFDVSCREEDPSAEMPRRIVMAIDYLHLQQMEVTDVFERIKQMVREEGVEGDEVMVVALNGGLRIEQRFTADRDELFDSLHRMEYDVSLFSGHFAHANEIGWVGSVTALLDTLGAVPGHKAVVLFSAMGDVPMDLQFAEIAAVASTSRCSLYPVDARGLARPVIGSRSPG